MIPDQPDGAVRTGERGHAVVAARGDGALLRQRRVPQGERPVLEVLGQPQPDDAVPLVRDRNAGRRKKVPERVWERLFDKLDVPVERLGGSTGKLSVDTLAGV